MKTLTVKELITILNTLPGPGRIPVFLNGEGVCMPIEKTDLVFSTDPSDELEDGNGERINGPAFLIRLT
jgi:hypothetical protein